MKSRAIVVIGMHRSGTSAVARGINALSVYLGNDFLDAQPENPTGYWEDRGIVDLNDRVLRVFGLTWDDVAPIAAGEFRRFRVTLLRSTALRHLKHSFARRQLWGFKDPRTLRLLPFWRRVLRDYAADDSYVLVLRNPLSVAASLFRRQQMDPVTALRLWLVYVIPYLRELQERPIVVVDYDRLMQQPAPELARIAERLGLPAEGTAHPADVDRFASEFLDKGLRHSIFTLEDFDTATSEARLTREAYLLLDDLAADRRTADAFWNDWHHIERAMQQLSEKW